MNPLAAAWGRVPNRWKAELVIWLLIPFAFAGGAFLTLNFKTRTFVQTRTVTLSGAQAVSRMSARQLVASLGKPDKTQPESGGVTCAVWQSRALEICWR